MYLFSCGFIRRLDSSIQVHVVDPACPVEPEPDQQKCSDHLPDQAHPTAVIKMFPDTAEQDDKEHSKQQRQNAATNEQ